MDTPLKSLRSQRGLTTVAVANAVGIDQGTYWRIENGAGTTPDTAAKIVRFFGDHSLTELHILYPERYTAPAKRRKAMA